VATTIGQVPVSFVPTSQVRMMATSNSGLAVNIQINIGGGIIAQASGSGVTTINLDSLSYRIS
jgi:hypothetical protein